MEGIAREPNGRASRSGIHHEPADVVAIEARMRQTGLGRDQARDQKAATYIGYLNLLGRRDGLSTEQYDAAVQFLELRDAYLRAIKAPNAMLATGTGGTPSADDSDGYIDWCDRTRKRYEDCSKAIMAAQMENRTENLLAAKDLVLIRDERHGHLVGATRILCNALAKFFGTMAR